MVKTSYFDSKKARCDGKIGRTPATLRGWSDIGRQRMPFMLQSSLDAVPMVVGTVLPTQTCGRCRVGTSERRLGDGELVEVDVIAAGCEHTYPVLGSETKGARLTHVERLGLII
jgi:hypothetical protein